MNTAIWRRGVLAGLLTALWTVCVYRAVTQSITHDEALTYRWFVAAPWGNSFYSFDANHHFLNTVLMKLSVAVFGDAEWSLRLPALAGAGFYFAAVYRIGVRVLRTAAAALLAAALMTLNPFVLDFMVAARGYGMALGLLTWAIAELAASAPGPAAMARAGVSLGLAVAANLTFAVPAFVVAVVAAAVFRPLRSADPAPVARDAGRQQRKKKIKTPVSPRKAGPNLARRHLWACLWVPLAAVGIFFCIVSPLRYARSYHFYVGSHGIAESLRGLAAVSVAYAGRASDGAVDVVAFLFAPAVLAAALAVGIWRRNTLLIFAGGAGVGSAAVLLAAHIVRGVPYPEERTGIYFLALVPLCLAGLADMFRRSVTALFCAAGLALAVWFVLEFQVASFRTWRYDADSRLIAARLAQEGHGRQPASVTVNSSWLLEPSLNFYRVKNGMTWMRPIPKTLEVPPGADLYALTSDDRPLLNRFALKPLAKFQRTGSVVAVPSR